MSDNDWRAHKGVLQKPATSDRRHRISPERLRALDQDSHLNLKIVERDRETEEVLTSYASFLRTINHILIKRHSLLLAKQADLFTMNIDLVFEVALEQMRIDFSDGFSGKIRSCFDLGDFNTLRYRMRILPTGTCVVSGVPAQVPVMVKIASYYQRWLPAAGPCP